MIDFRSEADLTNPIADLFQIKSNRMGSLAGTLSGGNQQKVALGKWLSINPRLLLVEEPTRGVDVGARAEIYTHLRKLANEGLAIVFASPTIRRSSGWPIAFSHSTAAGSCAMCTPKNSTKKR